MCANSLDPSNLFGKLAAVQPLATRLWTIKEPTALVLFAPKASVLGGPFLLWIAGFIFDISASAVFYNYVWCAFRFGCDDGKTRCNGNRYIDEIDSHLMTNNILCIILSHSKQVRSCMSDKTATVYRKLRNYNWVQHEATQQTLHTIEHGRLSVNFQSEQHHRTQSVCQMLSAESSTASG